MDVGMRPSSSATSHGQGCAKHDMDNLGVLDRVQMAFHIINFVAEAEIENCSHRARRHVGTCNRHIAALARAAVGAATSHIRDRPGP
jgi:hypothetical protein